jgi:hypothetical protein
METRSTAPFCAPGAPGPGPRKPRASIRVNTPLSENARYGKCESDSREGGNQTAVGNSRAVTVMAVGLGDRRAEGEGASVQWRRDTRDAGGGGKRVWLAPAVRVAAATAVAEFISTTVEPPIHAVASLPSAAADDERVTFVGCCCRIRRPLMGTFSVTCGDG